MKRILLGTVLAVATGLSGQAFAQTSTGSGVAAGSEGQVVASSCTETELERVSDSIEQAEASVQEDLRQKFQQATEYQNDDNLQLCADTLAEIQESLGMTGQESVATPD